jgi:exonuclease III
MVRITTYLSILTLNVNRLNFPIKRHHLANWIKKEDPTIWCLQILNLIDRKKHQLKVKDWKKIYQTSGPPKQAGVAILISHKVDFKLALIKWDKEGHFILKKRGKTSKGNNNYQPICTQHQCTQFHQTYSKGLKSTYRLQHSGSGRLKYPPHHQ